MAEVKMKRSTSQERAAAWAAYDKRMGNYMTTKSDRNLPAEQTPEYKFAAAAIRPEGERSLRYNTGKADYSLIPLASMKEAAKVLEYGATKYAVDNWRKPQRFLSPRGLE
jgi:hypothetical protein